ncbi:MAG: anthranilate synthase component I family protein, partial [Actinomycetia bacterium]|nr:anthranilate synthase component I family protein [Actinomycetes bacterium]
EEYEKNIKITGLENKKIKGDIFETLRYYLKKFNYLNGCPKLTPFTGGAVGFFSYDISKRIETIKQFTVRDTEFPDAFFIFPKKILISDNFKEKVFFITLKDNKAEDSLIEIKKWLEKSEKEESDLIYDYDNEEFPSFNPRIKAILSKKRYSDMVRKAIDYIFAGDIYQVNLSQRFEVEADIEPFEIFKRLRKINPSPFGGFIKFEKFSLISSSPERLVRLEGDRVETRPIAGTRPKGETDAERARLREELRLDPKERAEHVMLVDLERNDLGRVCEYGTVRVDELMTLEEYSHVIHIVSNIQGALKKGKDALDLIKAVFPGGTITGCPKVRCMEIIEELEPVSRGPYTGSMGYIGFDGDMDMNIIIRTIAHKGKKYYAQAGSGIVADSIPEREYYESLKKAEAMLKALNYKGSIRWKI